MLQQERRSIPPSGSQHRWLHPLPRQTRPSILVDDVNGEIRVYATDTGGGTGQRKQARLDELDLLITDLKLPGMGGHALLAALRERRPDLPALLISGFDAEMSESGALGEGVSFLQKPFTPTALALAARAALQNAPADSTLPDRGAGA